MQQYKKDFIELLVKAEALKFGEFTYKSGRVGPYFFNAGSFNTGELVSKLGEFYAAAYADAGFDSDVIFGPAYKGIPLSVTCVNALYRNHQKNLQYCFNRKEVKDHGDGKLLVGAKIDENSKLVLIDDVITAGTAIRETFELLKQFGSPKVDGILISLDRMEKGADGGSALGSIEEEFDTKVVSIVTLDEVIEVLHGTVIDDEMLVKIDKYRAEYGV